MTPTTLPPTETRNPLSMKLDGLSTLQMVQLMNQQDATVPVAIAQVLPQIAQTVDIMAAALAAGHRVFYQGAGTSGRLAVLDAVELLPTFRLEPDRVIPLLAGGDAAMMRSVEGAEDDEALGRADLMRHNFSGDDVLLGVAASGRTPYALGGLHYAAELGARSAALVCNGGSAMAAAASSVSSRGWLVWTDIHTAVSARRRVAARSGVTRLGSATGTRLCRRTTPTWPMASSRPSTRSSRRGRMV